MITYFDWLDIKASEFPKTSQYLFKVIIFYRSAYSDIDKPELNRQTKELYYVLLPNTMIMKEIEKPKS